jgi:hypothetical protein
MATTPINNIVREVAPKSLFASALPVLSTAVTYNQGDLLSFDATNNILKPVTGNGDSTFILGVAVQTVVSGIAKSPYIGTAVDASQGFSDFAGPQYGVVASLKLASGQNYTPGAPVYLTSTDAQTVTSAAGGSSIGLFQGRTITSAATGLSGDVLVGARYNLGSDLHV